MKSHGCGTSLVVNQFLFSQYGAAWHFGIAVTTSVIYSVFARIQEKKIAFHSMVSYYGHSAIAIIHKWRMDITRAHTFSFRFCSSLLPKVRNEMKSTRLFVCACVRISVYVNFELFMAFV